MQNHQNKHRLINKTFKIKLMIIALISIKNKLSFLGNNNSSIFLKKINLFSEANFLLRYLKS